MGVTTARMRRCVFAATSSCSSLEMRTSLCLCWSFQLLCITAAVNLLSASTFRLNSGGSRLRMAITLEMQQRTTVVAILFSGLLRRTTFMDPNCTFRWKCGMVFEVHKEKNGERSGRGRLELMDGSVFECIFLAIEGSPNHWTSKMRCSFLKTAR
jgi:hypothetical protein